MKKIYIVVAAFILSMPLFALDITLRVPMSLTQSYVDPNDEVTSGSDMVASYGFELGQDLYLIQVGGGMQWDAGTYSPTDGNEFKQRLMYGYLKYNLFPVVFKPYIVGKLGTTALSGIEGYNSSTTEGGTYTAFGLGIDIFNLQGELLYSIHDLTLDDEETTQSMLSLVLGIKIF